MSKLVGKNDFKRMRYPVHIIITVLFMFYIGKNSFRNIVLIFRVVHNVKVSHTTIGSHLSPYRNSQQAFALLNPVKSVLGEGTKHIRVESFKDDISNNLIESFHHLYVLEIVKANFKVI